MLIRWKIRRGDSVLLLSFDNYSSIDLLQKYKEPLPNPPLSKGREPDYSCFPPYQGGTEGGNL